MIKQKTVIRQTIMPTRFPINISSFGDLSSTSICSSMLLICNYQLYFCLKSVKRYCWKLVRMHFLSKGSVYALNIQVRRGTRQLFQV